jgi:hypothetical protein
MEQYPFKRAVPTAILINTILASLKVQGIDYQLWYESLEDYILQTLELPDGWLRQRTGKGGGLMKRQT